MMGNRETGSIVAPLAGSALLGTGAYGSWRLDRALDEMGLMSGLKLNPEAVDAIRAYANLRPSAVNPHEFAVQYAQAANRAGSSKLFLNDNNPTWWWEMQNNRLREGIRKKIESLSGNVESVGQGITRFGNVIPDGPHTPKWIKALRAKILGAGSRVSGVASGIDNFHMFSPLNKIVDSQGASGNRKKIMRIAKELAHTPEMAQSPMASYIRLLSEVAGGIRDPYVVDNTVEALLNYRSPTYKNFRGKKFKTPSEYLSEMWSSSGEAKIPGAYDKYVESLKEALKRHPTNEGGKLAVAVREMLYPSLVRSKSYDPTRVPHSGDLLRELREAIGNSATWKISDNGKQLIRDTSTIRTAPGIRSVQDIVDRSLTHPGLQLLNARAAQNYSRIGNGYGRILQALRVAQFLRSGKLRAAAAIGSAGLAGLGTYNILKKNNKI